MPVWAVNGVQRGLADEERVVGAERQRDRLAAPPLPLPQAPATSPTASATGRSRRAHRPTTKRIRADDEQRAGLQRHPGARRQHLVAHAAAAAGGQRLAVERVAEAGGAHAVAGPFTARRVSSSPGRASTSQAAGPVDRADPGVADPGLDASRRRPGARPGPGRRPAGGRGGPRRRSRPRSAWRLAPARRRGPAPGRSGPWPRGAPRSAMPARRARSRASFDTESRSPTTRSTGRPRASAWSSPASAAITQPASGSQRADARDGGSPPDDDDAGARPSLPPLALPRSGSRVGGGRPPSQPGVPPSSPGGALRG